VLGTQMDMINLLGTKEKAEELERIVTNHLGFNSLFVSTGQVYLILGKNSGWSMDTNLSNADASWHGEAPWDYVGYDADGVGDVNGDGFFDAIMSSPGEEVAGEGANSGAVYVIYGSDQYVPTSGGTLFDLNSKPANMTITGEDTSSASGFGYALAKAVKLEVDKEGLIGAFTGGIKGTAGGISGAIVFGYIMALVFNSKTARACFEDLGIRTPEISVQASQMMLSVNSPVPILSIFFCERTMLSSVIKSS